MDDGIKIINRTSGRVIVEMPASLLHSIAEREATVSMDPLIRKATMADAETILNLESKVFSGETSLDTAETTSAVVKKIMDNGGEIFLLARATAFFERIPLQSMLTIDYSDLGQDSPLRKIGERKDLLKKAQQSYLRFGKEIWYLHGIGSLYRNVGDASRLVWHAQGTASSLIERLGMREKVSFGYIDIGPTQDNINIASFRLCFGSGAIADGFEPEVYSKEVPYLRVSYGSNVSLNQKDRKAVDLRKESYLADIRQAFAQGYLGTDLILGLDKKPIEMIFYKKLAKK